MAIGATLSCATNASEGKLHEAISRACGITLVVRDDGAATFSAPGLRGTIVAASPLSRELIDETYHFVPTAELLFRLDKFEAFDVGFESMLRVCVCVIRDLSRDCVLKLSDDEPVLLKKDGRLLLQQSKDDGRAAWLGKLAEGIGGPFSFGELPGD